MVAASAHHKGSTRSASKPSEPNVIQKILRCINRVYPICQEPVSPMSGIFSASAIKSQRLQDSNRRRRDGRGAAR